MLDFWQSILTNTAMTFFVFLCLVQVVSIVLALVAVRRLMIYVYRYRFPESSYTLLLGFLRLRYFVVLYLVMVALVTALEMIFAFSLLSQLK